MTVILEAAMSMTVKILAVAALLGLSTGAALAQEASPCVTELQAQRAQEAKDAAVVGAILKEANAKGFAALNAHLDELKAVLARAPAHPIGECNGRVFVRAHSASEAVFAGLVAANEAKEHGGHEVVVDGPSPYGLAAFLIGSAAVERSDWTEADAVMKRGLEIDPGDLRMVGEEALVLSHLHRPADAVKLCDDALNADGLMEKPAHARLLRTKGFALGELGRFDEAIAAYQQSLVYEPGHGGALNEIAYLTKRKAGGEGIPETTFHGDAAKAMKPDN